MMSEMPTEAVLELPDCAPTKVLPLDLRNAIAGKEVQKHYASELLGIRQDELIPTSFFTESNYISPVNAELFSKITFLLSENDVCDKVGIQLISKVYNIGCFNEGNELGQNICNDIKQSKTAVAKLAILFANEVKIKLEYNKLNYI